MPVSWISHKGKQILYSDFRGLKKNEDLFATLDAMHREVQKSPAHLLLLIDARDASFSGEFMNQIKSNSKTSQVHVHRMAILGVSGLKKILVDGYQRVAGSQFGETTRLCETEEEAKEYLVG